MASSTASFSTTDRVRTLYLFYWDVMTPAILHGTVSPEGRSLGRVCLGRREVMYVDCQTCGYFGVLVSVILYD
jgi:hypothetical protein